MKTLYDLLGALPNDEAEDLRTAFRKAVKGVHPDLHPGDPDAGLKFRQIARANEILGDPDQRAAYDHLLELARLEQELASKRATAARIHKFASGTMALAGASVITVGGYLLFMHMSVASIAPANEAHLSMRAPTEIAAVSPGSVDTTNKSAPLPKYASASVRGETIVPKVAMAQGNAESVPPAAANVGPPLDLAARDAKALRARGISAFRNGDVNGAIANLDQAIQLDPKFSVAYIDRGIILHRLREFDRAFADIPRGKRAERRIEKASRTKSASAERHHVDQARIAPSVTPASQQRTAAQDPSREESVAAASLR